MNSDLKKIIECLSIRDAYLHNAKSYIAKDFNPKYSGELSDLAVQFKHMVASADMRELEQDGEKVNIFFVYIDFGVRWISLPNESKDALPENETDENNIKAYVEATYVAEYKVINDPDEEVLSSFAVNNVSYHLWPYWREYIMSQCNRMNLPKVTLPIMQQAEKRDTEPQK